MGFTRMASGRYNKGSAAFIDYMIIWILIIGEL